MVTVEKVDLERKFLKIPLLILHVFGLWRRNSSVFLYRIYSFFILVSTQYLYALFQIIYMIKVWGDLEKVAEASFLLLTQVTLCLKISFYLKNIENVVKLTKKMNFKTFAPKKPFQIEIVNSHAKGQLLENLTFLILAVSTISLWAIFPLFDSAPGVKQLPLKAWYPVKTQNESPYYEIIYAYQIIGILFSALINASIDRFYISMTAFGCAELLIVHDNLVNIERYTFEEINSSNQASERRNSVEELEENVDKNSNIIEDLVEQRLIKCINHHKEIVRFVGGVEGCFHLGILAQLGASIGIICVTGLQITTVNPKSIMFVSKAVYLLCMLSQIYFICRIGDSTFVISRDLKNAAYNLPWMNRTKKFNKSLIIFMERLKQPIITRAGRFFPLSLQTFMSILRMSYSYFAVLKQVNSEP